MELSNMARKDFSRDVELLSAFLDNQLSTPDRNQLQKRLIEEPGLRRALDELRQTRALLRRSPRLKAPRSFALTREMVIEKATAARLVGSLRTLSLVSAVLLAVVFTGDMLGSRMGAGMPAAEAPSLAAESANQAEPAEAEFAGAADSTGPVDMTAPSDMAQKETATPEAAIALSAPVEEPVGEAESGEDRQSVDDAGQAMPVRISAILLIEAALLLTAIGAGMAAWWLRRRKKS